MYSDWKSFSKNLFLPKAGESLIEEAVCAGLWDLPRASLEWPVYVVRWAFENREQQNVTVVIPEM